MDKLFFGRMTDKARKELDILLESPTAKKILQDAETEVLSERAALVRKRRTLASEHAKPLAAAAAEYAKAEARYLKAREELQSANANSQYKLQLQSAAVITYERAVSENERELLKTTDPRVWTYLSHLDAVDETVRGCTGLIPTASPGGELYGNIEDVIRVRAAIAAARGRVEQLRFEAANREEVTAALTKESAALIDALAQFGEHPPFVQDDEVSRKPWRIVADQAGTVQ